jgi:hypothetical protein
MLITNIEIGTINGEVVEAAINVVIKSQWHAAAHVWRKPMMIRT